MQAMTAIEGGLDWHLASASDFAATTGASNNIAAIEATRIAILSVAVMAMVEPMIASKSFLAHY